MKTSLGIWAFGPMITRFVPGGYQPEHGYESEPVAEKWPSPTRPLKSGLPVNGVPCRCASLAASS